MLVSSVVMLYIYFWPVPVFGKIAWTWYVFIGSLITLLVAWLASFAFSPATEAQQNELSRVAAIEDSVT
jgi:hypothetical protein